LDIYYTLDGSNPTTQSNKYNEPFLLTGKAILKAVAIETETGKMSEISSEKFDIAKTKWKMAGEFAKLELANNIFDGNPNTAWTLRNNPPIDIIIDLGETIDIKGFTYLPDQGRWNPGIIFNYEFYVSTDGKNWGSPVSTGEFSNIKNSPVLQEKQFQPVKGKFIKFRALSPAEENGKVGMAEFGIITE
jgi:alpha-L-fucosidase